MNPHLIHIKSKYCAFTCSVQTLPIDLVQSTELGIFDDADAHGSPVDLVQSTELGIF